MIRYSIFARGFVLFGSGYAGLGALRNMTYRREIPIVKTGRSVRYRLLDLLAWIEERSVPALE